MTLWESIRVALRALAANKLRSALTMLGIIIGVAAVIALLAIGQGAQDAITREIQAIGSNVIVIFPGSVSQAGVRSASGTAPSLTLGDAEALADPANAPDLVAVAPTLTRSAQVVYNGENVNTRVTGTTPLYATVRNYRVARGRFLAQQDLDTLARVAVLGDYAAQTLFKGADPLNQLIRIKQVPFRVVGVLEPKGGSSFFGGNQDDAIYIPITTAQVRLLGGRTASGQLVSAIVVSAASEERISDAIGQITWTLRRRHKIEGDQDDFTVLSQQDLLGAFNEVTTILTVFLAAIAGISLLVGGIGIMNIMLVSVTERTREIGIRKAVGAKRRDILMQFLIEAVLLSLVGGALGILTGTGAARAVEATGAIRAVLTPSSVLLAVGFSVAVGLFFGLYPAARASALNPIEALRYE